MDSLPNHGIVVRELRKRLGLSLQIAARRIGKSVGWLSEIENCRGESRLGKVALERIVTLLDGERHRPMFKTWIANHKNEERRNRTFDGAILRHARNRRGLSVTAASELLSMSKGYLSRLERGICHVTLPLRNRILVGYGYSTESFKNWSTDPVKSKAVPLKYKFDVLMQNISDEDAEIIFRNALSKNI
jgi:transcriptional regulator with XRE-family HTH domain